MSGLRLELEMKQGSRLIVKQGVVSVSSHGFLHFSALCVIFLFSVRPLPFISQSETQRKNVAHPSHKLMIFTNLTFVLDEKCNFIQD